MVLPSGLAALLFLHSLRLKHTRFVFQKTPPFGTARNNLPVWLIMLPDPKLEGEEVDLTSLLPDLSCFCNYKPPFIPAMLTFQHITKWGGRGGFPSILEYDSKTK